MPRLPTPRDALLAWVGAVLATTFGGTLLVALLVVAGVTENVPGEDLGDRLDGLLRSPTWLALTTFVNELLLLGVVVVALRVLSLDAVPSLGLVPTTRRAVLGACALVFGVAPFASAAAEVAKRALGADPTVMKTVAAAARSAGPAEMLLLFVALALAPAVAEEALFRGVVQCGFSEAPAPAAIGVSAVTFGLIHLEPVHVVGTTLLGAAFATARHVTGSLVPPMVAHGVYNTGVLLYVRFSDDALDGDVELGPLILGALGVALGWSLLRPQGRP